jgi:hypothetical protein
VDGGGGANGGNNSSSSNSGVGAGAAGGGAGPLTVCDGMDTLCTDFDEQGPALSEAGCGGNDGGTCTVDLEAGELRITPNANTGFWAGGESTFVNFQQLVPSGSFFAHTLVEFSAWPTAGDFSLAGLVVRDSSCPANAGSEADCTDWFKAEIGRLSALPELAYPNNTTTDSDVGLRSALHSLAFAVPPIEDNVEDILFRGAPAGPYQVAICAIELQTPNSFGVRGAYRPAVSGASWSFTESRTVTATSLEVGLVAARGTVSGFVGRFGYLQILPINPEASDCDAQLNIVPLP